jgi:pimeloyl-ACP methyl ester carboxylesterase
MKGKIPYKNQSLNANVVISKNSKQWVLFLCGGSLETGKERFLGWQNELKATGVSSVAFDYVGVPGTWDTVGGSSLQSRIEQVISVVSWIEDCVAAEELIVYGVSMGGYLALGATAALPGVVSKLVLHAPAAYTKTAQELPFDTAFTKAISQPESWDDARSFSWLAGFTGPVLFFQPELDEVIPAKITNRYVSIGKEKSNFAQVHLPNATHRCWGGSDSDQIVRKTIATALVNFIKGDNDFKQKD